MTDLEGLRVLNVVLQERSVTRAAARLGVSQSAVSQRLRKLRAHLDDPLVVPSKGGLIPTDRARRIQAPLQRALGDLERCVRETERFDPATSRRTFHIALGDYGEAVMVPNLLTVLRAQAPEVSLVTQPRPADFTDRLERGALDVAVVGPDAALPETLKVRPLPPEGFVVLRRHDHPIQRLTAKAYLEARHLVVAPGGGPDSYIDDRLARLGHARDVAMRVSYFMTGPLVAATSDLLMTSPAWLASTVLPHLPVRVARLPFDIPGVRAKVVWHPRSQEDPGHRWFRRLLLAETDRFSERALAALGRQIRGLRKMS